jgi:hypothetical protein
MAGATDPIFTQADVDEMRQLSESSLDCTCDVLRPSEQVVGSGGTIRRNVGNPPPIASGVRCRWANLSGAEKVVADQLAPDAQFVVVLPIGVDVQLGDHLAISGTARSNDAGVFDTPYVQTVRVVGLPRRRSYLTLWRVFVASLSPAEA